MLSIGSSIHQGQFNRQYYLSSVLVPSDSTPTNSLYTLRPSISQWYASLLF